MLVVSRYVVPEPEGAQFQELARTALTVLAARPGFRTGRVGRATDDATRWVMQTSWASVGDYRRALSASEVRLHAVPLMYRAVDEPSAYEVLLSVTGQGDVVEGWSALAADAGSVDLGEASGPDVPRQ